MADDLYAFTKTNVDMAPAEAGVYALYRDGTLVYIGRAQGGSVTIRSRLQRHQAGTEGACTQNATHYWRKPVSNPVEVEKRMLEDFQRQHGRLPACNSRIG